MSSGKFLLFRLEVDEDGWPPVGAESLPVKEQGEGLFQILVPPVFIKNLSVNDVVAAETDSEGYVTSWAHTSKSKRTTIWVLQGTADNLGPLIDDMLSDGGNVERFNQIKLLSFDVPESVSTEKLDMWLRTIEAAGAIIAEPSFRHLAR